MSVSVINNFMLVPQGSLGEVVFPTPGTWQWTCPTGVTTISGVCIGGGGGGESVLESPIDGTWSGGGAGWGGSIGWGNNISVTPGTTYTIQVGSGGTWGNYIDITGNIIPSRSGGDSSIYESAVNANLPFYPVAVTGDSYSYSYLWFDCRTSPNNRILGNVSPNTIVRSPALYSNTRSRSGLRLDSSDAYTQGIEATNLANVRVHISKPIKNYTNQAFYFIGNSLITAGGGSISISSAVNNGEYPYYNNYGRNLGGSAIGGIGYNGTTNIYDGGSTTVVWLQGGGGAGGYTFAGGAGGTTGGPGAQGGSNAWWTNYQNRPAGAGGGGACFNAGVDRFNTEIPVPMAGGGGGTGLYGRGNDSSISSGGAGGGTGIDSTKGGGGQGAGSSVSVGGNGTNYPRICRDGINTNITRTGGDYGGGGAGGVGYWNNTGAPQGGGNGGSGGVRIMWGGGRTYYQ